MAIAEGLGRRPGHDGSGAGTAEAPRPVRSLLRREWAVLQPRYRAGYALVFFLGALQSIRSDEAYLWLGILLAGALAVTVPVIEWRLDADRLVGSLPVRRRDIVLARYLVAGAALLGAWGVWAGTGSVLGPILAGGYPGPRIWADLPGTLAFFALAGLLTATFLPLYFSAGMGRAAAIFPLVAIALVALAGWAAGLAAPTAWADSTLAGNAALVLPGAAVRQAAAALIGAVGAGGAVAASATTVLGVLALSARASLAGFRRREL